MPLGADIIRCRWKCWLNFVDGILCPTILGVNLTIQLSSWFQFNYFNFIPAGWIRLLVYQILTSLAHSQWETTCQKHIMRVNVREYEKIISEDVLILINNFIFHTPIVIDDTFKIIFHGNAIPSNPYLTAFRTDEYRFQHQHPMLFNFYRKRLACLSHTCQCQCIILILNLNLEESSRSR